MWPVVGKTYLWGSLTFIWLSAVKWVLPFFFTGLVVGILAGWLLGKNARFYGSATSAGAVIILILSHRYVIGQLYTWDNRYVVHILSAALGGFLGAVIPQFFASKRRKRE